MPLLSLEDKGHKVAFGNGWRQRIQSAIGNPQLAIHWRQPLLTTYCLLKKFRNTKKEGIPLLSLEDKEHQDYCAATHVSGI